MRGKTDEKIVLTDLRFRVRTRATQADRCGGGGVVLVGL